MQLAARDFSILRTFATTAALLTCAFAASLLLPPLPVDFPILLQTYSAVFLCMALFTFGVVGFFLCLRGEPLVSLSLNLMLAPCFFIFAYSDGAGWLSLFSTFVYGVIVLALCNDCRRRA